MTRTYQQMFDDAMAQLHAGADVTRDDVRFAVTTQEFLVLVDRRRGDFVIDRDAHNGFPTAFCGIKLKRLR